MLAHIQAKIMNKNNLSRWLSDEGRTVAGYLDLLVDALLMRRLLAWHRNAGKRLIKAPMTHLSAALSSATD